MIPNGKSGSISLNPVDNLSNFTILQRQETFGENLNENEKLVDIEDYER